MSFRRASNRADCWQQFLREAESLIAACSTLAPAKEVKQGERVAAQQPGEGASWNPGLPHPCSVTSLPPEVFRSETNFEAFLTTGVFAAQVGTDELRIVDLSDETFLRLEAVVNRFYFDGYHQLALTALAQERRRRFGRDA